MKKFMALFYVPAAMMQQWMANTDEATRKEQGAQIMAAWAEWAKNHEAMIVDAGSPLGKTKRVTKDGTTDTVNDLNYSMIVQADSHEAAAQIFLDNPHLAMIPDSYVDVMEIPHTGR